MPPGRGILPGAPIRSLLRIGSSSHANDTPHTRCAEDGGSGHHPVNRFWSGHPAYFRALETGAAWSWSGACTRSPAPSVGVETPHQKPHEQRQLGQMGEHEQGVCPERGRGFHQAERLHEEQDIPGAAHHEQDAEEPGNEARPEHQEPEGKEPETEEDRANEISELVKIEEQLDLLGLMAGREQDRVLVDLIEHVDGDRDTDQGDHEHRGVGVGGSEQPVEEQAVEQEHDHHEQAAGDAEAEEGLRLEDVACCRAVVTGRDEARLHRASEDASRKHDDADQPGDPGVGEGRVQDECMGCRCVRGHGRSSGVAGCRGRSLFGWPGASAAGRLPMFMQGVALVYTGRRSLALHGHGIRRTGQQRPA